MRRSEISQATSEKGNGPLGLFHPAVRGWFARTFKAPTPPQLLGWPHIAAGENTLILAPTGSGKTLAAFLACINHLLEELLAGSTTEGVQVLYISPLKALNYDIERNLQAPLTGIMEVADQLGLVLPEIRVAVRTGDTTQHERQHMIRRPPHILITTPESLHLILTSHRAREILRPVQYLIVDEIHAISDNKRGTFLALLLERLERLAGRSFLRIGLSATQKPLDEVGRFLGGYERICRGNGIEFVPRRVAIVDAGMRKELDLKVLCPVQDLRDLPEDSIWPAIYRKLLELIRNHRSTLIFANNRRAVERITSEINNLAGYELVRAHHGSVSKQMRRGIERELKEGKLPALVATASLELGIDMGAIDLVCQVESPKSVATGLQRVGRAGHLYKAASKGRLLPKTRSDLLETVVISDAMRHARVSSLKIPRNCLDVLAQQIVAIVAMEPWDVDELYDQVRQAYPYRDLPRLVFNSVLEMLSGRYPSEAFRDLRPRISWDRMNNRLHPMPGSQRLTVVNGGAIPDTGQFGVYLEDGSTRVGELDEEFVYETRIGDLFILGTNTWRVTDIGPDRVIVAPASLGPARMPFWRGEYFSRDYELGRHLGAFCRQLRERLNDPTCQAWLRRRYDIDPNAAFNLCQYLRDQEERGETIPDDRTVLIEGFRDEIGDLRLALLSPFGGRVHLAWRLAILAQFRRQWQIQPESMHSDTGILFRLTFEDIGRAVQAIRDVSPDNLEELVIEELAGSPLFGLRFRQNAARALLLPRGKPGRRTPLWLQRLKARDLLEIARQYESFPIVVETYRECMQDFLEIEGLKELLGRIEAGEVKVIVRERQRPSPFASSLMFDFTATYLYEWDQPKAGARIAPAVDQGLLKELLQPAEIAQLVDDGAVKEVEGRLQGEREGYRARTDAELLELLRRIGDLTREEIEERLVGDAPETLNRLSTEHRLLQIFIPDVEEPWRWIDAEEYPLYRDAFSDPSAGTDSFEGYQTVSIGTGDKKTSCPVRDLLPGALLGVKTDRDQAQRIILERFLRSHAMTTVADIRKRYPFDEGFIRGVLQELEADGAVMQIRGVMDEGPTRWAFRETIERIRRLTMAQQRRQVEPCGASDYVDFLLRWQHRHPETKVSGQEGLLTVLGQLQGLPLSAEIIDGEVLARRVEGYRPAWLDELCGRGDLVWYGSPSGSGEWGNISFAYREILPHFRLGVGETKGQQSDYETIRTIRDALNRKGASFLTDLVVETGLSPSECAAALWDMIWSGEVTNDSFVVIRSGRPARRADRDYPWKGTLRGRPERGLRSQMGHLRGYRAIDGAGRWSLVPEPIQTEAALDMESLEVLVRQLLARYGMVCRELYALEGMKLPWRLLYQTLVRLEWRGEVRRGLFVKSFSGGQFALPQAADQLRDYSKGLKGPSHRMILINACDPANLYGAAAPLPLLHPVEPQWHFLRHPGNYLVLQKGMPVLAVEGRGNRLTPLRDLSEAERKEALSLLPQLLEDPGGLRRIRAVKVEYWDGQPVRNSEVAPCLKSLGFRDELRAMTYYRRF